MKVAVIGAGNGGYATAADVTLRGHEVALFDFPEFAANVKAVSDSGGIEIGGGASKGFAKVSRATTNIKEALDGAAIVIVTVPANAHRRVAETCAPYLRAGQVVFLDPGSQFGALEFANVLKSKEVDVVNGGVLVTESPSLYYSCRRYGNAKVWVMEVKTNLPIAAFPGKNTKKAVEVLNGVYPSPQIRPSVSMLETSLNSLNCWHHPPYMIFDAVDIENGESIDVGPEQKGYEKVKAAASVKNTKKAMDVERMTISKALGLETFPGDEWPKRLGLGKNISAWPEEMREQPKAKDYRGGTLKMRYLTEDIPFGLVPVASLGDMIGVETPTLDAIITIASVINETDYRAQGRTMKSLGLAGMSVDKLRKFAEQGKV